MTSQSETMATSIQRQRWLRIGLACIVASPVRGGVNITIADATFEAGRRFGGQVYWLTRSVQACVVISANEAAELILQELSPDQRAYPIEGGIKIKGVTIDEADSMIRAAMRLRYVFPISDADIAAERRDIHRDIVRYVETARRTGFMDRLNAEYADGCRRGSMPPYRAWLWSRLRERFAEGLERLQAIRPEEMRK